MFILDLDGYVATHISQSPHPSARLFIRSLSLMGEVCHSKESMRRASDNKCLNAAVEGDANFGVVRRYSLVAAIWHYRSLKFGPATIRIRLGTPSPPSKEPAKMLDLREMTGKVACTIQ